MLSTDFFVNDINIYNVNTSKVEMSIQVFIVHSLLVVDFLSTTNHFDVKTILHQREVMINNEVNFNISSL